MANRFADSADSSTAASLLQRGRPDKVSTRPVWAPQVLNGTEIKRGCLSQGSQSASRDANIGAPSGSRDCQGRTLYASGNSFQATARNMVFGSAVGDLIAPQPRPNSQRLRAERGHSPRAAVTY